MSGTVSTTTEVILVDSRVRNGTVSLPLSSEIPNRILTIKDAYGNANLSSITIQTQGSDTFENGATSITLALPYEHLTVYAGLANKWIVQGGSRSFGFTASTISSVYANIGSLSASTINGLPASNYVSTGSLLSTTFGVLCTISTAVASGVGAGVTSTISTSWFMTSSVFASTISSLTANISSLTVNSLQIGNGTSWLDAGPLRATALSTLQLNAGASYTTSNYFGTTSSGTALLFYGLQGGFQQTALAELSTGVGTQELLVFKGSSVSDRIRMQTTGSIVFEPGVAARIFSTTLTPPSNLTPAMIINASSNVGIQTATPQAALDVAGTGRFQTISSLALSISSINGSVYGTPANLFISTLLIPFSTFNTVSTFTLQVSTPSSLVSFGTNAGKTQAQVYVGDLFNQLNYSTITSPTFLIDSIFPQQNTRVSTFRSSGPFTVPAGVTYLNLHMWGSGGTNWNGPGGGAAFLTGFYPVRPGEVYHVVVGRGGGGGIAGGGYTGLFMNNLSTAVNLVACAGGGGGGGSFLTTVGGGGGVVQGKAGTYRSQTSGGGGVGGGQNAYPLSIQTNADKLIGETINVGGGGGWYGGGGGGNNSVDFVGGGGGSSYFSNLPVWMGEDGQNGGVAGGKFSPYYASNYGDCNTPGAMVIAWSQGIRRANQFEVRDITQTRLIGINENLSMGIRVSSLTSTLALDVNDYARISTLFTPLTVASNFIVPFSTINPFLTNSTQAIFAMNTLSSGSQVAFGTTQAYGLFGKYSQVYMGDMRQLQSQLSISTPLLLLEQDFPLVASSDVIIVNFSTTVASYTAPVGTVAAKCYLWGGGGTNLLSGNGAFVSGAFRVNSGEQLAVAVNYGRGAGGTGTGGGLAGIFRSTITQANSIAIAGGGGSAGNGSAGGVPTFGGGGGVVQGATGFYHRWSRGGAGGGTQTAGGSGASPGSALQGGGTGATSGGGGGYFGGGGNDNNSVAITGGGGGSSFIRGLYPGSVVAENGGDGTVNGEPLAGGQFAPYYFGTVGAPGAATAWATVVFVKNVRRTNLLEVRGPLNSTIVAIDNLMNMGIGVSSINSSIQLEVGGYAQFNSSLRAQSLSSLQFYTSSIQASALQVSTVSTVAFSASTLTTDFIQANSISSASFVNTGTICTNSLVVYGPSTFTNLGSTILQGPVFLNGQLTGTNNLVTSSMLISTTSGLAASGGVSSTLSTFLFLTSSIRASSIFTDGTQTIQFSGSASASLYGPNVDTLTLATKSAPYTNAIASMAFGVSTSAYPLARIYALDSAASGSPLSQLIFQNVPTSPTSFNSNYTYTGADQTFIVPTGVTTMQVTLWGAGGSGGDLGITGGAGAFVQGLLTVIPGQTYTIVVGQGGVGGSTATTYGGGGASAFSGSGGGRAAIMLNVPVTISSASGSGTTITFTTSGTHGLVANQPVVIAGLSPSGFNGTFVVTSPSANQFTVVSTQTGSSTGTGTILAEVVNAGAGGSAGANGRTRGGAATFSGTAFAGTNDPNGSPGGSGGSQTAGGAGYAGGSALRGGTTTSGGGGGGAGYYGGGSGSWGPGGGGGGGGGSSYTSFTGFALTAGSNSPNSLEQAPATTVAGYVTGVAAGSGSTAPRNGGNGLVLVNSIGGSITEAMRIGSNGYLGIGTTTPATKLDVAGTGRFQTLSSQTLVVSSFFTATRQATQMSVVF